MAVIIESEEYFVLQHIAAKVQPVLRADTVDPDSHVWNLRDDNERFDALSAEKTGGQVG